MRGRRSTRAILFVCAGNICRSPAAQAVFEHLLREDGRLDEFVVDSAGTTAYHAGQAADPRMVRVAAGHGVAIRHRARSVTPSDFSKFDLILAMDSDNLADLRAFPRQGENRGQIALFRSFDPQGSPDAEVPDPYYGGPSGFEEVFAIVARTCGHLLDRLTGDDEPRGDALERSVR